MRVLDLLPRDHRALQRLDVGISAAKGCEIGNLAANLLRQGKSPDVATLWPQVQAIYIEDTGDAPAESEQGEIRLVIALFLENQLVP